MNGPGGTALPKTGETDAPPLPEGYAARPAAPEDAALLDRFRVAMFRHLCVEFDLPPFDEPAFTALDAERLAAELASGNTLAWFVERDGRAVASAALTLYTLLPKPWNPSASYGYISSVYTDTAHRRRGLARHLLHLAVAAAGNAGCGEIVLHGASAGRPLYEALGFKATNEMRRRA